MFIKRKYFLTLSLLCCIIYSFDKKKKTFLLANFSSPYWSWVFDDSQFKCIFISLIGNLIKIKAYKSSFIFIDPFLWYIINIVKFFTNRKIFMLEVFYHNYFLIQTDFIIQNCFNSRYIFAYNALIICLQIIYQLICFGSGYNFQMKLAGSLYLTFQTNVFFRLKPVDIFQHKTFSNLSSWQHNDVWIPFKFTCNSQILFNTVFKFLSWYYIKCL